MCSLFHVDRYVTCNTALGCCSLPNIHHCTLHFRTYHLLSTTPYAVSFIHIFASILLAILLLPQSCQKHGKKHCGVDAHGSVHSYSYMLLDIQYRKVVWQSTAYSRPAQPVLEQNYNTKNQQLLTALSGTIQRATGTVMGCSKKTPSFFLQ
jgi:hypothetical protein